MTHDSYLNGYWPTKRLRMTSASSYLWLKRSRRRERAHLLLHTLLFDFTHPRNSGAYGISSLYICDVISKQSNPHHIDAFQASYHNIGVQNLRKAGFGCWELIEQRSEFALPNLLRSGVKEFVLVYGYHTFDNVLVDFFHVDRLLEDGGIVAFDDALWAPERKSLSEVAGWTGCTRVKIRQ